MKKVITLVGSIGLLAGLSQICLGQYGATGSLELQNNPTPAPGDYGGNGIYYAGLVNMTFTPNEGPLNGVPDNFVAYCTVLDVEATFGTSWGATELLTSDFAPQPPGDLGNDNNNYTLLYGGDGAAANATVGGELAWIANYDSGTALQDAAAQVAIWDIEQGGNGTAADGFFGQGAGGLLGSGVEASWTFGSDTAAVRTLAMADAAGAFNSGGIPRFATDIWYQASGDTTGNPVSQDFLTPSGSPEPFTLGIGAAGIGLALLRRVKRSS